jgi:hypothetical protein
MKKNSCLLLFCVSLFWFSLPATSSFEELFEMWRQPVEFTSLGIAHFFTHTFNQNLYGQAFLPQSLDHLIDFLDYGIVHNKSLKYFKSSIELFHQRCKECSYINVYSLHYFLDKFSHQMAFMFYNRLDYRQEIKNCIRKALYTHENSEEFFESACQEIHKIYYGTPDEPSRLMLAQTCTRFIESLLDKVIWNPREQERTWNSFLTIAQNLENLYQLNIIPDSHSLNLVVWSLIYRYCYFISSWGSELLPQTYTALKYSLEQTNSLWLVLEEQESFLLTKRERLMQAFQEGYFKACSKEKGIISDPFINKK